MAQTSAGILLYRLTPAGLDVLLAHPGGPFWAKKDAGAWSIPKGLVNPGEDFAAAAAREFFEETGAPAPASLLPLGSFRQPGGKLVVAFASEGDLDPAALASNTFELQWPPRSGRMASFPEIDRVGWFDPPAAHEKLLKGQLPILEALLARADASGI